VQQIFGRGGSVAAHLVYLHGERVLDNGRVDVAAGRLPVGAYFVEVPLYCDFLNVIFCGNPHLLPIYPSEGKMPQ
jgi:porin